MYIITTKSRKMKNFQTITVAVLVIIINNANGYVSYRGPFVKAPDDDSYPSANSYLSDNKYLSNGGYQNPGSDDLIDGYPSDTDNSGGNNEWGSNDDDTDDDLSGWPSDTGSSDGNNQWNPNADDDNGYSDGNNDWNSNDNDDIGNSDSDEWNPSMDDVLDDDLSGYPSNAGENNNWNSDNDDDTDDDLSGYPSNSGYSGGNNDWNPNDDDSSGNPSDVDNSGDDNEWNPNDDDSTDGDLNGYPGDEEEMVAEAEVVPDNSLPSNNVANSIVASEDSKVNNIGEIINNIEIPASCAAQAPQIVQSIDENEES